MVVNEIIGNKRKDNIREHLAKSFPGVSCEDLSTNFNRNFAEQVPLLKKQYKQRYITLKQSYLTNKQQMESTISNSMAILPISIEEACTIINNTKNTNSPGIDGFLIRHFKQSRFNSAILISKIINKIIETECWPDKLKMQVLRPIYKKGKKVDLNNYRPISLLPVLDKFIEKFFAERISTFLHSVSSLTPNQYGFRKNLSTSDALKEINDKIAKALNKGRFVGAVLIDLQKAFDTVNHEKLLDKCSKLGIRGKIGNIIKSYMQFRKITTKIGNSKSEFESWDTGVPQGSVLGPLLFLIYINDITKTSIDVEIFLFADDTFLLAIDADYNEMILKLQKGFNKIEIWCAHNDLFINEHKTQVLNIFSPHKTIHSFKNIFRHEPMCTGNNCETVCFKLAETTEATYLGIKIDSNWSYKKHIDSIIKKLKSLMPKLYHLKKIVNKKNNKALPRVD